MGVGVIPIVSRANCIPIGWNIALLETWSNTRGSPPNLLIYVIRQLAPALYGLDSCGGNYRAICPRVMHP